MFSRKEDPTNNIQRSIQGIQDGININNFGNENSDIKNAKGNDDNTNANTNPINNFLFQTAGSRKRKKNKSKKRRTKRRK
jgi:hypothetical protein